MIATKESQIRKTTEKTKIIMIIRSLKTILYLIDYNTSFEWQKLPRHQLEDQGNPLGEQIHNSDHYGWPEMSTT